MFPPGQKCTLDATKRPTDIGDLACSSRKGKLGGRRISTKPCPWNSPAPCCVSPTACRSPALVQGVWTALLLGEEVTVCRSNLSCERQQQRKITQRPSQSSCGRSHVRTSNWTNADATAVRPCASHDRGWGTIGETSTATSDEKTPCLLACHTANSAGHKSFSMAIPANSLPNVAPPSTDTVVTSSPHHQLPHYTPGSLHSRWPHGRLPAPRRHCAQSVQLFRCWGSLACFETTFL